MNNCSFVGHMTKDVQLTFSEGSGNAIGKFGIAVQRDMKDKKTGKYESDFINCVAFGKTAEFIANYGGRGRLVEVSGRIQTGSYEKDGRKIYTTDLMVDKFKPLEWNDKTEKAATDDEGFTEVDSSDELPF